MITGFTRKPPTLRFCSTGLSLIELMISILLGLLLSLGIVTIYLESKRNYASEEEIARIQENGRFAINLLKRELTLAGFYAGNLTVDEMAPAAVASGSDCVASGNWALDAAVPIDFTPDVDPASASIMTKLGATFSCIAPAELQGDSDLLSVKRTSGDPTVKNGAYLDGVTAAKENQWYLRVANFGDEKEWRFIAEGENFDSADIGIDTKVDYWEFYSKIFYVRSYSVADSDGNPLDSIPTLCVEELQGNGMSTECMVEGVEEMHVEFGIDLDADGVANQYKADPDPSDMAGAVSARIYLLLRGINEINGYSNTKTYRLGSRTVDPDPDDGFLRRVFTTTVQTRNAALPVAG